MIIIRICCFGLRKPKFIRANYVPYSKNVKDIIQMKMQESDFRHALEIITRNNRITVSFNTPIADNYSHVYPLLIHESNASVLKQLHEAGFSMSMTKKGLEVSKY